MKKIIFTTVSIILFTVNLFAQVNVYLEQPPPFQFKADNLWKVTLNNSGNAVSVYLFAQVTDLKTNQKVAEGRTSSFSLPTGTKKVNAAEISPIDIKKYDNDVEKTLNKAGTFKSGEYNICIYARSSADDSELGSYCNDYEILNITQTELIMPEDMDEVYTYQPMFSWLPPTPYPTGVRVTYEISFYPILNRQSAYYATISNPASYVEKNIKTNLFQYPLVGRRFVHGMKYAWQVKTYFDGSLMNQSEIRTFLYKDLTSEELRNDSLLKSNITDYGVEQSINIVQNNYSTRLGTGGKIKSSMFSTKPFEFGLSYKIGSNFQNEQSKNSESPANFGYVNISPTVSLYGIPFKMDLYLDTKQKEYRQNINSFALLFDFNSLKDKLTNTVGEELNTKSIPGHLKFISMFKEIGIWETYPNYTEYTVSGVKVKGLDFTFNPGLFYLKATGLGNLEAIADSVYARNLYAGSIGVGEKEKSHLHFTYMKSFDRENSINPVSGTSSLGPPVFVPTPGENTLLGADGKLSLLKNRVNLESEAVVTVTTRDKFAPKLAAGEIPSFLENLTNANTSSQYDLMYRIKGIFNLPETKSNLGIEYKLIGPGFISYGAPGISGKGQMRLKVNFDQEFLDGLIMFNGGYEHKNDNVGELNSITTYTNRYDFKVKFKFDKTANLTVRYMPIRSFNNGPFADYYENDLDVISVVSGYKLSAKSFIANSMLLITSTKSSDNRPQDSAYFSIVDFTFREDISFKKLPLTISASVSYNIKNTPMISTNMTGFGIFGSYTMFDIWSNSLGFNFTNEWGTNRKFGLSFTSSVSFWNVGDFYLTAEQNFYREKYYLYGNNDEFVLTATISKSF